MFRVLLVLAMLLVSNSVFGYEHTHDGYLHYHILLKNQAGRDILVGYTPPSPGTQPDSVTDKSYIHEHDEKGTGSIRRSDDGDEDPPPTVPQPTVPQPTVTQPTTVVESGTSEGTSSPQPVGPVVTGSAPRQTRPASPVLQPIRVTEYMVRDWSKGGAWIGNSNLPQWIELHNPNATAVNLKGWTFQYATRFFANQPYTIHTLTLAAPEGASEDVLENGFSIPGGGVAILSTQQLREEKFSGIEATQVYNLNIENVLKRGWVLTDANGKEVQRIGRDAFSALRDPVAPRHQEGARVSYQVYLSESPSESYYYGDSRDIGSPGFYEQAAPSAPSAVRPKRIGTWAALKR